MTLRGFICWLLGHIWHAPDDWYEHGEIVCARCGSNEIGHYGPPRQRRA